MLLELPGVPQVHLQSLQPPKQLLGTTGGFCHEHPVKPEGGELCGPCLHPGKKLDIKQSGGIVVGQRLPGGRIQDSSWNEVGEGDTGGGRAMEERRKRRGQKRTLAEKKGDQARKRHELEKRIVGEVSRAHPDPTFLARWDLLDL